MSAITRVDCTYCLSLEKAPFLLWIICTSKIGSLFEDRFHVSSFKDDEKTTEVFSFKCLLVIAIVNHFSRHSFSILKQLKHIGFRIPVLVPDSRFRVLVPPMIMIDHSFKINVLHFIFFPTVDNLYKTQCSERVHTNLSLIIFALTMKLKKTMSTISQKFA